MTLHLILGDGYMPTKELTAHLQDMREKANADDEPFWFMVAAKPEPTDTDRAIVKWLTDSENDIYFDAIGDKDSADKIYSAAQMFHKATRLAPKVVQLMEKASEGDAENDPEGADLLALFFSDEDGAEEDRWLNDVVSAVSDAGFPAFAFNDGMTLIEPPDAEPEKEPVTYTREQLESLDIDELKKIAIENGVTVPPRSRRPTYIDAILGEEEDEVPEVEMSPVTPITPTTDTTGAPFHAPTSITGAAMILVVLNGTVTSLIVTADRAEEILSF